MGFPKLEGPNVDPKLVQSLLEGARKKGHLIFGTRIRMCTRFHKHVGVLQYFLEARLRTSTLVWVAVKELTIKGMHMYICIYTYPQHSNLD